MATKPEDYNLIPAAGTPKVGRAVYELVAKIVKDKIGRGLHEKWVEHYRLSRNRPWKNEHTGVPLNSANLLHTHRQRTVNTLTDNEPTFNVAKVGAVADGQDEALEAIQRASEYWWREQEQQSLYATSVNWGEMNGVAIEKYWFDPDLELGLGEVRTENVDPFHFGVWPLDTRMLQDAEACFHFYPMSVREVKKRWPQQAEAIKPDSELLKELGEERQNLAASTTAAAAGSGSFTTQVGELISAMFGGGKDSEDDQTLVIECWVKDTSAVSDSSAPGMVVTRPQYPGGIRRVTVCSAGQVVLDDTPNPSINPNLPEELARITFLYDKFPFALAVSLEDSCSLWGQSDWEQLAGLQKEFSKTLSQFGYFKDRSVRPKVLNPRDSGISNDEFTNDFGVLNPNDAVVGQGVRYLEFSNPALMAELQGAMSLIKELFFLVAGTFELEQAQTPGRDVVAYKAIAALLEHAATMMRGKIRNYQKLIRERGRAFVSLMQNYYTEERFISYEDEGQTETMPVRGPDLIVPARLTVVSGSTLPRSDVARREEALELFKMQAIDLKELLRVLDWPNRAEVIQRMEQGPLGQLLQRLGQAGFPEQVLQVIEQLGSMDDKEFARALQGGQIPQLPWPGQENAQDPLQTADLGLKQAEQRKVMAEVQLLIEKAVTERARQQEIMAGIELDTAKVALAHESQALNETRELTSAADRETERTTRVEQSEADRAERRQQFEATAQQNEKQGKP